MKPGTKPVTGMALRRRLAANMRRLRLEAGLTQDEAAERVEMHTRHWQALEWGEKNATIATITRVANALGVDPTVLLAPPPRR